MTRGNYSFFPVVKFRCLLVKVLETFAQLGAFSCFPCSVPFIFRYFFCNGLFGRRRGFSLLSLLRRLFRFLRLLGELESRRLWRLRWVGCGLVLGWFSRSYDFVRDFATLMESVYTTIWASLFERAYLMGSRMA